MSDTTNRNQAGLMGVTPPGHPIASDTPRFTQSYTTVDKTGWGDGPWRDEFDKAVWVDPDTDLDCMIVRGPGGALCGYVGVPEGHPLFGLGYSDHVGEEPCDHEDTWCEHRVESMLTVHGGITFAAGCDDEGNEETAICHIPQPGRSDKVWWFGFDTAHSWDFAPASHHRLVQSFEKRGEPIPGFAERSHDEIYRDLSYVVDETAKLAEQLVEVSA